MAAEYRLRLFVSGDHSRSRRAIATLRKVCSEATDYSCELTVIDVLEHPDLAEQDRILATPTLLFESPEATRRIVGELTDPGALLARIGSRGRNGLPERGV